MMNLGNRFRSLGRRTSRADKTGQYVSFWSLGRKVTIAHLGHVLLLSVLLGWGAYWVVLNHIQESKPTKLKALAQIVAGLSEKEIKGMGLLAQNMIESDAVLKYKNSDNVQALKQHLHQYADKFLQISFLSEEGDEVFRLSKGAPDDSLPSIPAGDFLSGEKLKPNRLQVFTSPQFVAFDVPIIKLAYRHVDFFDESLGTIVASVSLEHLSNAILASVETGKSTIAVIDSHGHILFSTEQSRPSGLSKELESLLLDNDASFGRYRLFGKDSLVARLRISDLNWTVLVAQPEDIYYADARKLTWGIPLILAALFGGSILLGLYITRGIVRPVLLLNEKISQVSGSQDLTQRVEWTSGDEFGMLADSYNKMLGRLHEAHTLMDCSREKISHLAFHDSLTDLPNRAMLMECLESELAQAKRDGGRLAILSVGLDNFQLVNDTMGQKVGDQVLCMVTDRLQETVRINDFLCRPGGDQFIVFTACYGEAAGCAQGDEFISSLSSLAQRIVQKIKEPFLIDECETYVSTSIGISIFPDDADNAQAFVQHADGALCQAKDLGGGQIQFYVAEFTLSQKKRMDLATRLNKALDKKEFLLFYQPVVNLAEGRIVGVEALIRWQTEQGLVSPGEFIPLAEEIGLIHPIGDWVMREACSQIRQWNDAGVSIPSIAINLSARQFWHGDIAAQLQKAVEEKGIQPESLELEITESSVMKDPLRMEAILMVLHRLGFSLSLDDFGTGYSSLLRLKHLPFGKLKIDRSFMEGVPRNADNVSLVNAIVQLSHNLGIQTQAEGIETAEQWRYLRDSGCEFGQGHYFSPPVSAMEIEDMVSRGHHWTLESRTDNHESGQETLITL